MQLITRLDFDGIVCAAMIAEMEDVTELFFSNPKEMEMRKLPFNFRVGGAVAHLPFHPDARLWFHHHDWEHLFDEEMDTIKGKWGRASSTAQLVKEHYDAPVLNRFDPLVEIANKLGTADLTVDDILNPQGWMLLASTLDPHITEDTAYGVQIYTALCQGKSAEEILGEEGVAERVQQYKDKLESFRTVLKENSRIDGNVVVTDFRELKPAPRGNRFIVFHDFPDANVQVQIENHPSLDKKFLVSASKSIFNPTLKVKIGQLMEQYGGGGITGAGTCPIDHEKSDARLGMIINSLKA